MCITHQAYTLKSNIIKNVTYDVRMLPFRHPITALQTKLYASAQMKTIPIIYEQQSVLKMYWSLAEMKQSFKFAHIISMIMYVAVNHIGPYKSGTLFLPSTSTSFSLQFIKIPVLSNGSSFSLLPFPRRIFGMPNFKKLDLQIKKTPNNLRKKIFVVMSKLCLLSLILL